MIEWNEFYLIYYSESTIIEKGRCTLVEYEYPEQRKRIEWDVIEALEMPTGYNIYYYELAKHYPPYLDEEGWPEIKIKKLTKEEYAEICRTGKVVSSDKNRIL